MQVVNISPTQTRVIGDRGEVLLTKFSTGPGVGADFTLYGPGATPTHVDRWPLSPAERTRCREEARALMSVAGDTVGLATDAKAFGSRPDQNWRSSRWPNQYHVDLMPAGASTTDLNAWGW